MKKFLFLLLATFFIFNINDVHAEPNNYKQVFSSNANSHLTTINGLTTYDISSGVYFTHYAFLFDDSSLQKGKTYHVEINLYGSLGDGYFSFSKTNYVFYGSKNGGELESIGLINFHMDGTGIYRSLVFDFYLHDDFTSFNLTTHNPEGTLYYQYSGSGKFGWYGFNLTKVADNEDALKDQNNIIIGQNSEIIDNQKETNQKLDKVEQAILGSSSAITDTINDTNVDDAKGQASDFFVGFQDNDHGLSGVVTAPLEFLQSLTASQCTPLHFELPIVHNEVDLPCMKAIYEEHFGIFFTLWQSITTGLISYHVCINLYKKVRDLQNPKNDRIEVLNL